MALLQVAEAVGSQTDLNEFSPPSSRLTPLLVGVEACLVFLWDDERHAFVAGSAYGLPRDRLSAFHSLHIPGAAWPEPEKEREWAQPTWRKRRAHGSPERSAQCLDHAGLARVERLSPASQGPRGRHDGRRGPARRIEPGQPDDEYPFGHRAPDGHRHREHAPW